MTAAQAIFNRRRRQTKEKAKAEMRRTTTQPYTAAQMFALADDIERYPQFLPWCESVQVQRQPPKTGSQQITATLHINYKGIRAAFSTENQHDKPARITMRLAKGGAALSPMAALNGEWQFANTETGGCQTTLDLQSQGIALKMIIVDYLRRRRIKPQRAEWKKYPPSATSLPTN